MKFIPTEKEKAALLSRDAHGEIDRSGLVTYELCPLCGLAQWKSRDQNQANGVEINIGTAACGQCQEVQRRAPEIFQWVISVFKWRTRLEQNRKDNEAAAS